MEKEIKEKDLEQYEECREEDNYEDPREEMEPAAQGVNPQLLKKPSEEHSPERSDPNKRTKIQVDLCASVQETLGKSLPIIPESETPYSPILYTFRVKTRNKSTKLNKMFTKLPPFYLLFDHTIAVIWTLFNKDAQRDNLGVVQLQWALYFLESIHNSDGTHPPDVQLCIDTILNYLIDEYAEMSEEAVLYTTSKLEDFTNTNDELKANFFSINYSQLIKKYPAIYSLDFTESTILNRQILDELENIKKVVGIESIDFTNVASLDQVMNILTEWKKEQIEKIQEELKMLQVVESMMKNSGPKNFEGYTDETQLQKH